MSGGTQAMVGRGSAWVPQQQGCEVWEQREVAVLYLTGWGHSQASALAAPW